MFNDEGALAFTDEQFDRQWRDLVEFFSAERVEFKLVAPLPYLNVPDFPLRLNNGLVLDRLTEDEVTRCCQVSVLRPQWPRFPLIQADVAVGIRRTIFSPKLIRTGDEPPEPPDIADEGHFGSRPLLQDDLVIDDVLSALRLFKQTQVRTAGYASWTDSPWLNAGTSYRVLRQWPYGGKYELSADEVPQFLELWHLLEEGAARFGFSIHRFNLAFDRGLLADRIVDLVIAAESLFLSDLDVQDRGELRFRFALRAAKFIEHPNYSEHDIFRVMRRAYDARSAIVHGGSPKDTRLPDNQSATLPTFIDAIEELVRLGLTQGTFDEGRREEAAPIRVLGHSRILEAQSAVSTKADKGESGKKGAETTAASNVRAYVTGAEDAKRKSIPGSRRLTTHWSRRPEAYALLRPLGAAHRERSGQRREKPAQW